MGNLTIIHFSPLELYPPVQNFIRTMEKNTGENKITVFTTTGTFKELDLFVPFNTAIRIVRLGKSGQGINSFSRLHSYMLFYFGCISHLAIRRPKKILYYETISSFPAWFYRRFFNRTVELFIHYHEYTSPAEYQSGMKLTKLFHRLEKWLYPRAKWVSHTNNYRMELFETDIYPIKITNKQVVPNYPPHAWFKRAKVHVEEPVKVVYTGSLSMDTMYTKEFANWVLAQNGQVTWHVYAYNITPDAKAFLESAGTNNIVLKEGVNYGELPCILQQYDAGVVLYKGHISNYVYNAPNKVFEYCVCGLDVWFPFVMKGTFPYKTVNSYPKVIPVDFSNLKGFNMQDAVNKDRLQFIEPHYFCEEAFECLIADFCK
ncbi:MAG: hypothetical protein JWR61_5325 [Ferruginibacter sp.]|uniref:hypothetical protein n=1 Tax=Ferruginibacter sp. TaxID=1940288 RepID=UPI002659A5D1|nr:hypothetical protein [Ferruginibacter sp.]MDB5280370.1 hypothetical protein [Ferruginibacter sp.]